jgi:hypothetical protein
MNASVATPKQINKTKKYHFTLILPIFINTSELLIKLFHENNCTDMIPSIQSKCLNLLFYRESQSYEEAVKSAKSDVKATLEKLGFTDLKMNVINYEKV